MKQVIFVPVLLALCAPAATAGITVTAEAPGVQTTQVPNASVYTFDALPLGLQSNVTAHFGSLTGTYDQLYVRAPDIYGGANSSDYPVAAAGYGVPSYTLTLSAPVNYFGMFWCAGDASNRLDFYLGNTLVGTFTTATALGVLPQSYYGDPNSGSDSGEAFAYLNFFGTNGVTFDRVVLTSTNNSGGFESDNHAVGQNAAPSGQLPIVGTIPTTTAAAPALSDAGLAMLMIFIAAAGAWQLGRRRAGSGPTPQS